MTTLVLVDPTNGTTADASLIASNDSAIKTVINGNIDATNLASNAVTTVKITDANVTAAKLASNAVTTAKITDGNVTNAKLVAAGGTLADMPPGRELAYNAFTSPVTVSATTEGTATTIVTASAVTFDGATPVFIDFFCPNINGGASSTAFTLIVIDNGGASLGQIAVWGSVAMSNGSLGAVHARIRVTPSNASHTYSIRGFRAGADCFVSAGVGGTAAQAAGFVRITKV